ncbi:glycosyl hydrolase family 28-related protein [Luteibacter sp.]|uniref:glycosyl hydrolase family 28-related protein n=1 Tax=Luteibacter sp. TaxID=1886636 RepID=UPI0028074AE1|nr:glycosyl hydrolase family 28-related protein [Luteibacter sp.]MDQ8050688.1 glycosyl hydrolase family 28-related protein [Luteibacter sp.]
MTVPTTTNKVIGEGDGLATVFPFTFGTLPSGDLVVTLFDTIGTPILQTEFTNYTVLGKGAEDGGSVVFVVPPPAGYTVLIQRILSTAQPDDLKNQGSYYPRTVERMFDRRAMVDQQLEETISRTLTLPPQVQGVSTVLPSPLPLNLIGWDTTGEALRNFTVGDIGTTLAFSNFIPDRFTAVAAQVNFTLTADPGAIGNLDVSIDGVTQRPFDDYTYTGNTLTFVTPMVGGEKVLARYGTALPTGITATDSILYTPPQTGVITTLRLFLDSLWAAGASTGAALIRFLAAGTGAVPRTVQEKLRENVSVKDFGATGDGITDDTANIQKALDAVRLAGGGEVYVPPGTYIYSQSLRVGSNTRFYGDGDASVLKAKQVGYVGVNTGVDATTNCQAIRNYNHAASSLTDSDITIENLTIDWGTVTIVGGGAHCISMRYCDRPEAINCRGINGENVTAFRACRDSLVDSCHGLNQINCFFDHWEIAGNCTVRNCTGRSPDVFCAQGIQMNDTGDGLNTTALDFLVEGNQLYRVRSAGGQSTAIAISALDPGGQVRRARSIGNYVEDADIGIVFGGGGGQHMSMGDTFNNVTKFPIFFQQNTLSPSNCRVLDPHLIDCNHDPVNQALIGIVGFNNEVRGVKVTNTGGALYSSIVWFTVNAFDSNVEITMAPTGSGARVINSGSNCRVIDRFNRYEEGTWTPIDASGVGLVLTSTNGTYCRIGKMVFASCSFVMPATASGVTNLIGGLPISAGGGLSDRAGINISYSTIPAAVQGLLTSSATTFSLRDNVGVPLTNTAIQNGTFYLSFAYQTN